jgi:hypothetical protein
MKKPLKSLDFTIEVLGFELVFSDKMSVLFFPGWMRSSNDLKFLTALSCSSDESSR